MVRQLADSSFLVIGLIGQVEPPQHGTTRRGNRNTLKSALSQYVQKEECNVLSKNLGKLKGTDIKDLCGLVGGIPSGQKVRITAVDNAYKDFPIPPYTHRTRISGHMCSVVVS